MNENHMELLENVSEFQSLHLTTLSTFCLNNTPYVPPHRRQLYNSSLNPSPTQSLFVS